MKNNYTNIETIDPLFLFITHAIKVLLLWFLLLFLPFIIDSTNNHTIFSIDYMNGFVTEIKKYGHYMGITSVKIDAFISNSGGMILSLVSTVMSTGTGVVKRSEEKIYGIPKKRVRFCNGVLLNHIDTFRRANYIAPLLLIFTIFTKSWTTGITILLFEYIFMLFQYYDFVCSYEPEIQKTAVVRFLLERTKDGYYSSLDTLGKYIKKEEDWILADSLWGMLLKTMEQPNICLYKNEELTPYFITRTYYDKVFCLNKNEAEKHFLEQLEWFESRNYNLATTEMVLKGAIDSVINGLDNNSLSPLLRQFVDFPSRCISLAKKSVCDLTEEKIQMECIWIAILLSAKYRKESEMDSWDSIRIIMDQVSIISEENVNLLLGREYWDLDGMSEAEKQRYKTEIIDLKYELENRRTYYSDSKNDINNRKLINYFLLSLGLLSQSNRIPDEV